MSVESIKPDVLIPGYYGQLRLNQILRNHFCLLGVRIAYEKNCGFNFRG